MQFNDFLSPPPFTGAFSNVPMRHKHGLPVPPSFSSSAFRDPQGPAAVPRHDRKVVEYERLPPVFLQNHAEKNRKPHRAANSAAMTSPAPPHGYANR